MTKIKTFDDLKRIHTELKSGKKLRGIKSDTENTVEIKVAMATCGIAAGARQTMEFFNSALEKRNIDAVVTPTGCMGYCYAEPTIEITLPGQEPVVFGDVNEVRADLIIENYIKGGEPVEGIIPVNYQTINLNRGDKND